MSDLPADTLTTTIAEHRWDSRLVECYCGWEPSYGCPDREAARNEHDAHVAAAVVSVLATHNQHTAANALRDAADAAVPKFNVHPLNRSNTVRDWLLARADRLAAVSPTPPTHCNCVVVWDIVTERHVWVSGTVDGSCGHPPTGTPVPPTHTTTTEDQP